MKVNKVIGRIVNNEYIFSVIAQMFSVGTGVLYTVLFNRYMGASLKGESAIILNYVNLISVFMGFGIYQAYPRFKKLEGDIYLKFISNIWALFLFYVVVAIFIFQLPIDENLRAACIILPMTVFIKQLNYVVLIETPKRRNVSVIILNIIDIFIITFMMLFTVATYKYMVAFLFVKELIYLIIAIRNLRVNIFKIKPSVSDLVKYSKFGFFPMLTVFCMTVNYRVDILMLTPHTTTAEIGIYSVGVSLADRVWLIPDALKDILLSRLTKGKTVSEVAVVIRTSLFFCILTIVAVIIWGEAVIILLYGTEFADAYGITVIMLFGVLSMIFYKMIYSFNVVNGYQKKNLLFLGIAALCNIAGNYLLIPRYGIYGAAYTSVISYSVCGILFLVHFKKLSGIPYREIIFLTSSDIKFFVNKLFAK